MAAIAIQPYVMKRAIFTVDADDYSAHISDVVFTPTTSSLTWSSIGGGSFSDASSPTWTCQTGYAQDWVTPDSYSIYLLEHAGETVAATFAPDGEDGPTFEVNLIINAGPIGGAANEVQVGTVQLGVVGEPVLAAA